MGNTVENPENNGRGNLVTPDGVVIFDRARENHANVVTKRLAINMGFKCNLRCKFCYYLRDIRAGNTRDLSTDEVKRRLRVGREWGKEAVDLTGGEPTMRSDLPLLIEYAREIGYRDICIITNGWRIGSDASYLARLVDAGLNDILMSLHGAQAPIHDDLTGKPGAFDRLLRCIRNVKEQGAVRVRLNHVVCENNFQTVQSAMDLMVSFRPDSINFIVFQPTRDAFKVEEPIRLLSYRQVADEIKAAISRHRGIVPHINVRDIPYCLMKNFEEHVKTICQLQYEKVEWDYCLDVLFKKGRTFYTASVMAGAAYSFCNPYFILSDVDNKKHIALQAARIYTSRMKGPQCRRCAVTQICDGLVKDYAERNGCGELVPYGGRRISNPTYFMPRDEIE
ncbi:MAG: radical SAM protein [Desulfobacteraceae bacterium]|nr:radical SAM protein [Desulfobacteraceae bacterium]